MKNTQEKIKEMTLMLLYLTLWEENESIAKYRRSWKGYDFDVLNELAEDSLICDGRRSKSVVINDAGIAASKKLLNEYDI